MRSPRRVGPRRVSQGRQRQAVRDMQWETPGAPLIPSVLSIPPDMNKMVLNCTIVMSSARGNVGDQNNRASARSVDASCT